jgi:hypothetical protein
MSISMEHFGLQDRTIEPIASAGLRGAQFPYRVQCRSCGFEPLDAIASPWRCPKCAASAYEKYIIPGSLLIDADHRANRAGRFRYEDAALRTSQPNPNEVISCCDED